MINIVDKDIPVFINELKTHYIRDKKLALAFKRKGKITAKTLRLQCEPALNLFYNTFKTVFTLSVLANALLASIHYLEVSGSF